MVVCYIDFDFSLILIIFVQEKKLVEKNVETVSIKKHCTLA